MTTKYIRRTDTVEAFQFTEDRIFCNDDWPQWANDAWDKSELEEGSICVASSRDSDTHRLCLRVLGLRRIIPVDGYVVRFDDGALGVFDSADFKSKYAMLMDED